MNKIGVRELKNNTSKIIHTVREEMAAYVITHHGQPVALLQPLTSDDMDKLHQTQIEDELAEWDLLAQKIADAWTSPKSAVSLLDEQRRG